MDIAFNTRKIEKIFNSRLALSKSYGERMARAIAIRLAVLKNAHTLSMVPTTPPARRHQLQGKRNRQYAVDLIHPHRLIFEPNHSPVPRTPEGGMDIGQVTAITIIEVTDYH